MKRTLLAVGIAVLVSMMFVPEACFRYDWFYPQILANYQPFFRVGKIAWGTFALQTVFLAVLVAVIVNLRKSWRRMSKKTP